MIAVELISGPSVMFLDGKFVTATLRHLEVTGILMDMSRAIHIHRTDERFGQLPGAVCRVGA